MKFILLINGVGQSTKYSSCDKLLSKKLKTPDYQSQKLKL
jgi:hypothetical protein